jgi:hypothetical protein
MSKMDRRRAEAIIDVAFKKYFALGKNYEKLEMQGCVFRDSWSNTLVKTGMSFYVLPL